MKKSFVTFLLAFAVFLGAPSGALQAQTTHSHMGVHVPERDTTKMSGLLRELRPEGL